MFRLFLLWVGLRNRREKSCKIYMTVHSQLAIALVTVGTLSCPSVWTIPKFLQDSDLMELNLLINHPPSSSYSNMKDHSISRYTMLMFSEKHKYIQMITSLFKGLVKTNCLVVFSITRHHIKGLLCSWEFVADKAFQSGLPETVNDLHNRLASVTTVFTLDVLRHA